MKIRSLFTLALCLCFGLSYGQLKVVADNGGDVLIKNTTGTPRAPLDLNENTTNRTTAQIGSFGIQSFADDNGFIASNGFWNGSAMQSYAAGPVPLLQFFAGGVLFRTTPSIGAGATTLDLSNNIHCIKDATLGGVVGINTFNPSGANLVVTGDATKTQGGTSWSTPSDARLKQNINSFTDGLNVLSKMNIVEYEYNGKAGTKAGEYNVGIIAQEMEKVAPYMIGKFQYTEAPKTIDLGSAAESRTKAEEYLTYNDSALPYILANAIKEQQKQIEELKNEIAQLKNNQPTKQPIKKN